MASVFSAEFLRLRSARATMKRGFLNRSGGRGRGRGQKGGRPSTPAAQQEEEAPSASSAPSPRERASIEALADQFPLWARLDGINIYLETVVPESMANFQCADGSIVKPVLMNPGSINEQWGQIFRRDTVWISHLGGLQAKFESFMNKELTIATEHNLDVGVPSDLALVREGLYWCYFCKWMGKLRGARYNHGFDIVDCNVQAFCEFGHGSNGSQIRHHLVGSDAVGSHLVYMVFGETGRTEMLQFVYDVEGTPYQSSRPGFAAIRTWGADFDAGDSVSFRT